MLWWLLAMVIYFLMYAASDARVAIANSIFTIANKLLIFADGYDIVILGAISPRI